MKYLNRYIEKDLALALRTSGVVVVAGPKFCGKTETCKKSPRANMPWIPKGKYNWRTQTQNPF